MMSREPYHPTFLHTLKKFWNGKRFLMLTIFCFIAGNITMYTVTFLAQKQVRNNAIGDHMKVFISFMQALERNKDTPSKAGESGEQGSSDVIQSSPDTQPQASLSMSAATSNYWASLAELRRQFPQYRMNILLESNVEGEKERKWFDGLKNKPKGSRLSDEDDGWARSLFVLPTKNRAAFQVSTYIADDLNEWRFTALILGVYSFATFFLLGWFWTRALDSPVTSGNRPRFDRQMFALEETATEIGKVVGELKAAVFTAEGSANASDAEDVFAKLDEMAAQIRLFAVNGSIEAARDANAYRVFHVLMQEINHLADNSRVLLKQAKSQSSGLRSIKDRLAKIDTLMKDAFSEKVA